MKHVAKTESCACHLCLMKAHNFPEECAISIIGKKMQAGGVYHISGVQ